MNPTRTSWTAQWITNAPERFTVSSVQSAAILHGIEGLDPHNPVFERDQCHTWQLWHSVTVRENGMVFVRTPGGRGQCTQSLRALLAYHCLGAMETPCASSQDPCPCGQSKAYGDCCFPVVTMQCGAALCVNPFHMRVGRARDAEHAVPIEVPVLPACPSCAVCKWTPFEFYATALIRGYHETACTSPLRLDAAGRVVLHEWRREAIENQVGRLRAAESFDDARHARLYLLRSQNTLTDPVPSTWHPLHGENSPRSFIHSSARIDSSSSSTSSVSSTSPSSSMS